MGSRLTAAGVVPAAGLSCALAALETAPVAGHRYEQATYDTAEHESNERAMLQLARDSCSARKYPVENASQSLLTYFNNISNNRKLILKVFGIILFFIIFL